MGVNVVVIVAVGVSVTVMIGEIVPVTISGVTLNVGVKTVPVGVMVGVSVATTGLGAKDKKMNPMQ